MRLVALVIHTEKPLAVLSGRSIIAWLEQRSFRVVLTPAGAAKLDRPDLTVPEGEAWGEAELLIVLGGDGTLIRAVNMVAPYGVPVMGINTGRLGFLTAIENGEVLQHLEEILEGRSVIEERMMLTAQVERDGQVLMAAAALNDAVISKGPRARMVHLGVSVGETAVARYPADGVIVATPTGSTAYSLSAGGPIVEPTVDCLLITPICPHTISSRSIIVGGAERVTVTVVESPSEVGLSADGSDPFPLQQGDRVHISRAAYTARLVRRESYRFYDVLRQKLADPNR